jgi:hypothetical protein
MISRSFWTDIGACWAIAKTLSPPCLSPTTFLQWPRSRGMCWPPNSTSTELSSTQYDLTRGLKVQIIVECRIIPLCVVSAGLNKRGTRFCKSRGTTRLVEMSLVETMKGHAHRLSFCYLRCFCLVSFLIFFFSVLFFYLFSFNLFFISCYFFSFDLFLFRVCVFYYSDIFFSLSLIKSQEMALRNKI